MYGDVNGLTESEAQKINEWIETLKSFLGNEEYTGFYFSPVEDSENFQRCEICNLLSDTVRVEIYM